MHITLTGIEEDFICPVEHKLLQTAVAVVPCLHRINQSAAEKLYGRLNAPGQCIKTKARCFTCQGLVLSYYPDQHTRSIARKILLHKQCERLLQLKLVDTILQAERLYEIIATQRIASISDEELALQYACRWELFLKNSTLELSLEELAFHFRKLFYLLTCSGYTKQSDSIALCFYRCFVPKLRDFERDYRPLPYEICVEAFHTCKIFLNTLTNPLRMKDVEHILSVLPHLTNQPSLAKQQEEIVPLISLFVVTSEKRLLTAVMATFYVCCNLEHFKPRRLAIEALVNYARHKIVPINLRKRAIKLLPFSPCLPNIPLALKIDTASILYKVVIDKDELPTLRNRAAHQLSQWIWQPWNTALDLTGQQELLIDHLLIAMETSHDPKMQQTLANNLFGPIAYVKESDAVARYLLPKFQAYLDQPAQGAALKLQQILVKYLPGSGSLFKEMNSYAVELFDFMQRKLFSGQLDEQMLLVFARCAVRYLCTRDHQEFGMCRQPLENLLQLADVEQNTALKKLFTQCYEVIQEHPPCFTNSSR